MANTQSMHHNGHDSPNPVLTKEDMAILYEKNMERRIIFVHLLTVAILLWWEILAIYHVVWL
uniref:Uncharacterized protein n=1 Tax=Rhizophora mucronata TaxID=61149 RepID=A0A2P2Q4L5_RHIMU